MSRSGSIAGLKVVTQGVLNADFIDAGSGSCSVGQSYFIGQSCTVQVTFQPRNPGEHRGAIILTANDGGVLTTQFLEGVSNGALAVIVPGVIMTVAGNGAWVYQGDGISAVAASIFLPMGEVTDAAGNLYLSDSNNNRIRRVDVATGLISTVAGNGEPGFDGDNGLATAAKLSAPSAIVLDGAGNIYFADSSNHAIRRVDAVSGIITTVAGVGNQQGYSGDLGLAIAAKLNDPCGLVLDSSSNLYIADTGNNVIRKLTTSTGVITTVAGTGTAGYAGDGALATLANFNSPWGLAISLDGSLYLADLANHVVRRISAGVISTVAGTGTQGFTGDGGAASAATLNSPAAVAIDVAGNLYIADSGNNRVRKINAITGVIATIAGSASEAFTGDGGNSNAGGFYGPYSLFLDGQNDLFVGDMFHNRIRMILSNAAVLQYPTIRVSRVSSAQDEVFENDGNADLNLTTMALVSNAAFDPAQTSCTAGQTLTMDTSCKLGVEFAPTVTGSPVVGSINLKSNAPNSPTVIQLSGSVLNVDPTTIVLNSSANPSALGTPVTVTAQVSTSGSSVTGTVQLLDGTIQIANVALDSKGVATFTTSSLLLGQHSLTGVYAGDPNNASSTSQPLIQIVKQGTALAVQSSQNPSIASTSVTFTATLSGTTSAANGTITFSNNGVTFGATPLNASGVAVFSLSTLSPGDHTIVASYSGDVNNLASQSSPLTQTVAQATTTTSLTTGNGTVNVGATVTLTSTVVSMGGGVPTGTVAFKDGAVTLGTAPLGNTGSAAFEIATLAPGMHSITAVYQGDPANATSSSAVLTESVQQITTSVVLGSDANPVNAGVVLHLTATVSAPSGTSSSGALTGLITFQEGTTTLGTGNILTGGIATLDVATLAVGQHNIVAVYAGNTNYAGSKSVVLSQSVQQSTTSTSLITSLSPSVAGKGITLTATVGSVGAIATGTVTFRDGATIVGQGTLDAKGKASLVLSNLSVGDHSLVATYSGSASYATSTSATLPQTVLIATTSLNLGTSTNPATAGVPFTLTATLTGNGAQPTGSIEFLDGATVVGTVVLGSSGITNFSLSNLSTGVHALKAFYPGDANNSSVSSSDLSEVVQQAATSTSLTSSQTPVALGQSVTFTAGVTSVGVVPGGSITFQDGTSMLGTVSLNGSGVASLATTALSLGTHSIVATYSGDAIHAVSKSVALSQQILQATAISLTSSVNPAIAGKPVVFIAKLPGVSGLPPTGGITFKDGSTVLAVSPIDATGSASFTTATLTLGQHPIVAIYSGDTNYQAIASTVLLQTVQIANTTVSLTSNTNPAVLRASVTFTATAIGTGGATTGTITFEDGSTVIGKAAVNSNGVATFSTTILTAGIHAITALYSGDGTNLSSTSPAIEQQVQQNTTSTLVSAGTPSLALDPVVFTCTVANGSAQPATGFVLIKNGSVVLGNVPVNAQGVATLSVPSMAAGTYTIVATYTGDLANLPSISNSVVQIVQLRPTTEVLTATPTSSGNTQQVTLISVLRSSGPVLPTGTVVFSIGSKVLGSSAVDSTGVATLTIVLDVNSVNIASSYSGDSVYATSVSPTTSVSGGLVTQFGMTMSQTTIQLQSKQHTTISVTLSSISGFTDDMSLGCLGLPFAATCTFSSDLPNLAANGTQTIQIVIDTGSPLTAGSQATATRTVPPHGGPSSSAVLCFMPFGAVLGLLLFRAGPRKRLGGLLLLLVFTGITLVLSGCGGLDINGTPPGTYTFKVTASGVKTGVTQSRDIVLKVTQ